MPRVVAAPMPPRGTVGAMGGALAQAQVHLDNDQFAAAMDALSVLGPPERDAAVRQMIQAATRRDIGRAEQLALASVGRPAQTAALPAAAEAMLARDSDATLQWALAIPQSRERFVAMEAIALHLLNPDPRAALARLLKLPEGVERDEFLSLAAALWARRDADAALAWAGNVSPAALRLRITTSVTFEIARTAPRRAVTLIETLPEGRDRLLLHSIIGQTWVAGDAEAAWKWARGLSAPAAREAAIAGIETGLGIVSSRPTELMADTSMGTPLRGRLLSPARDPMTLPPGAERDRELRRQFEEILLASPVRAADWFNSLPPADRSDEMLDRLAREWLAQNPAAAEMWLDQNIISRPRRDQLLQEARR